MTHAKLRGCDALGPLALHARHGVASRSWCAGDHRHDRAACACGHGHIVHPDHASPLHHGPRRGGASNLRAGRPRGRGRRAPVRRRRPAARRGSACGWCRPAREDPCRPTRRASRAARGCARRSCRSRCPDRSRPRSTPAARAAVGSIEEEVRHLARPRRRSGGRAASCGGRPACASRPSRRRARPRRRQRGRYVVDERGARVDRGRRDLGLAGVDENRAPTGPAPRRPAGPGRSSSATGTGSAPGRVDSPPTSTRSAPSASSGEAMGDRGVVVEVAAAVAERVRGHVHHPHHQRPDPRERPDQDAAP